MMATPYHTVAEGGGPTVALHPAGRGIGGRIFFYTLRFCFNIIRLFVSPSWRRKTIKEDVTLIRFSRPLLSSGCRWHHSPTASRWQGHQWWRSVCFRTTKGERVWPVAPKPRCVQSRYSVVTRHDELPRPDVSCPIVNGGVGHHRIGRTIAAARRASRPATPSASPRCSTSLAA